MLLTLPPVPPKKPMILTNSAQRALPRRFSDFQGGTAVSRPKQRQIAAVTSYCRAVLPLAPGIFVHAPAVAFRRQLPECGKR